MRNFPLGYAYERPEIERIVAFRYRAKYPSVGLGQIRHLARRLRRYSRLPAVRGLIAELEAAAAREERGLPAHAVDTFSRLSRVAIMRNTELEELVAQWREQSVQELAALRADVGELVEDETLAARIDARFETARFPFRHDRLVPRITVAGSTADVSLEPGFPKVKPWTEEVKRKLIARGYQLTDDELRAHGVA